MKLLKAALCAAMVTGSFIGLDQQTVQAASYITIVRADANGDATQDNTQNDVVITREENIPTEPIVVVRRDTTNDSDTTDTSDTPDTANTTTSASSYGAPTKAIVKISRSTESVSPVSVVTVPATVVTPPKSATTATTTAKKVEATKAVKAVKMETTTEEPITVVVPPTTVTSPSAVTVTKVGGSKKEATKVAKTPATTVSDSTVVVTKATKASKVSDATTVADITADVQSSPNYNVLPIIEQGPFGNTKSGSDTVQTDQIALVSKTQTLVPIDVYRSANLNPITATKNGKYVITLPVPHTGGDMVYAGNPKNGVYQVTLPVLTIDGSEYIDMARISPVFGVTAQVGKRALTVRPTVGNVAKPAEQTLKTPIAWVFDPLRDTPYTAPLTTNGTSVISPSWFALAKQGLTVSPGVNATYVDAYKQMGYKVWPLVNNTFNPDFTATVLADRNNWYKAADELVLYALSYGFDGYNLDFENINYSDKAKLTAFVTYLANRLHEYNLTVSADVTGYSDSPNWSLVYDRAALGKVLDFVMLMAYDETGGGSPVAGPVARYPWVRSNLEQLLTEVPANKVILGVPFYMRTWTVPYTIRANGTIAEGRSKSKTLSMTDSLDVVATHASDIHWDDKAKLFYLAYDNVTGRPLHVADTGADEEGAVTHSALSSIAVTKDGKAFGTDITVVKNGSASDGSKVAYAAKNKSANSALISGTMTKIWFEDPKSLTYKLELVPTFNLAGAAAWRKGFETDAARHLFVTAMHETEKVTNESQKGKTATTKAKKKSRS